ncbi:MAG: DedA family protein [Magnetococcales bacterium]|nr:DedA family protein [Magnetococcales bacterium]MBF0322447.1 DedA family protein [Magnetococcales bacterium]
MSEHFTQFLLALMGQLDYTAIFLLMAAESSILPVPSELVMIPAGYLASQGRLDPGWIVLASSLGSIVGSLGSYYLALWLGRMLILRYGKYFLITAEHLDKTEAFVHKHGEISIFTGRFIPGIRHLVSMPAGLARMRLAPFLLFTFVGATLWNVVLLILGYVIGENQQWLQDNLSLVVGGGVGFALLVLAGYILWQRKTAR